MKKYGKLLCAFTLAVTVTLTGSSSIAVHATEQKIEDTKGKLNELQEKKKQADQKVKRPAKQQRQHGAGIRKSGCRAG